MPPSQSHYVATTLTPFLYPFVPECFLYSVHPAALRLPRHRIPRRRRSSKKPPPELNPDPDEYSLTPFADHCSLTLSAGAGGHGCVSFLREKYISDGPPNGGDGGTGGSIYIQAVRGETSLHKLARRGQLKAGRGRNGQGKLKGGERGEDVLIQVPVGTVLRELWRTDPHIEEVERRKQEGEEEEEQDDLAQQQFRPEKWLIFPGADPSKVQRGEMPILPPPRRSTIAMTAPRGPIRMDFDKPMEHPILLVPGAVGGLGNPHFITRKTAFPKFATRGEDAMSVGVHLELKILADVGLVGLPNAGKSTLLRSLTRSRARVGSWAFTTLQPNIGTVILDDNRGRPLLSSQRSNTGELRESFSIADIPGIIEDAHLDKGLGMGFLRHIERAGILAFVVDLNAGDAIESLKGLWNEVAAYETLRGEELNSETQRPAGDGRVAWKPLNSSGTEFELEEVLAPSDYTDSDGQHKLEPLALPPMSSKPWFVIATKADFEHTRENFLGLKEYLKGVQDGSQEHPSGKKHAWRRNVQTVPVSAIKGEGVDKIKPLVVELLEAEGL
ncbi:GTP-binding protein Obg/CgtA [Saccharata proteae CBS 121410]|uniref:GTP-binding protein Obg/CgtA n=1 Tax=Saccharata proteae CBS 121410 TaxID=1314787 RepID=A0A9P4M1T9_9PEZI|nr:GTP-binding protein Obg/CgtA [Saccharata proteae CBS 121410]